jgi:demethylspheroidene O-methyltransferase
MSIAPSGPAPASIGRLSRWWGQLLEQVRGRRDALLTSARFRESASRFALTQPLARRHARELFDLVSGFVYSQVLLACQQLRLFDRLSVAPLSARQLARESDLPVIAAERLLVSALALRLVQRRPAGLDGEPRFGLGPLGAAMVNNPAVAAMVEHHPAFYADLVDPLALLRSEQGGRMAAYWSYATSAQPGALADDRVLTYSALMASSQPLVAGQALDAYPMGRHRCLLDVGGGEGVFLATALQRTPGLRGMLFDLPAVVDVARSRLAGLGLADRVQLRGGDFTRDDLPTGADIVSLVRVLYDHGDERALTILRAVRRALPVGATLLVTEPMAEVPGAERLGAYFGMYLQAMGSGRVRSAAELATLLRAAGFDAVREIGTAVPLQAGLLVARAC